MRKQYSEWRKYNPLGQTQSVLQCCASSRSLAWITHFCNFTHILLNLL